MNERIRSPVERNKIYASRSDHAGQRRGLDRRSARGLVQQNLRARADAAPSACPARAAKLLGVPTVLTTNMADGFNGPLVQALSEAFEGQEVIDRTVIDAWQDPHVHEAVVATSRKTVIIAGT